jgi:type IV pilus assembly protein PilV
MQLNFRFATEPNMKTTPRHTQGLAHRSGRRNQTAGFALIEVLVAVLLFAIGILGLVGLQASMMQAQTNSKVRADAANLVDELSALIWSDLRNIAQYKAGNCAGNVRCAGWLAKLGEVLPGGTLTDLSFDETIDDPTNASFGQVTVTLSWTLPNGGAHKYTTVFNVAPATGKFV